MIGIIGGTGLYRMEGLEVRERREFQTPFGVPSAPLVVGELGGQPVAFLPRHGEEHQLLPSEIPYRANLWALKSVGVRRVVGVSATGSLALEIEPGDLAIPTQYFDWTRGRRAATFFGDGLVAHVSTAEPTCPALASRVAGTADALGTRLHRDRTYACVEGPRLGTRTESLFLQNAAGCHLVGMTNVPEAFLAREAQLCYCTVAIATDYDCWLDDPARHASVEQILPLYQANLGRIQAILARLLADAAPLEPCGCRSALRHAVLTPESALSAEQRHILDFLRL
ncbi:MAG: S-methyl-5'-thioadenosine phosphorylase [Gemmatimonadota bacterium]|nr:S-methyl-5'-thioadenosine phosphorylase [Gemmatimonadota bacterium]